MAWCPNCKNEYVDGILICKDCNCELTDTLWEEHKKSVMTGEETLLNRCNQFLEYNKIVSGKVEFSEEEATFQLYVKEEDEANTIKILTIFLQEEEKRLDEQKEEFEELVEEDLDKDTEVFETPDFKGVYQNSGEKAKEYKSTAYMLMTLGIIGFFVMVAGYLGWISLPLSTISYVVMGIFFLVFFVFGLQSLGSSKRLHEKSKHENQLHDIVTTYTKDNLIKTYVEQQIEVEHEDTEEILYFKRMEFMRKHIFVQFPNVDPAFVEEMLDLHYQEIYEV